MPNLNNIFPSRYLKSHELQGREPVVTIDRVEFEQMGRTREVLPVIYFRGKLKGLKLNKTMATEIARISGSALTEGWPNTQVQLYATSAHFGDQGYPVIRIKAPERQASAPPKPRVVPPPAIAAVKTGTDVGPLTEDEIPF